MGSLIVSSDSITENDGRPAHHSLILPGRSLSGADLIHLVVSRIGDAKKISNSEIKLAFDNVLKLLHRAFDPVTKKTPMTPVQVGRLDVLAHKQKMQRRQTTESIRSMTDDQLTHILLTMGIGRVLITQELIKGYEDYDDRNTLSLFLRALSEVNRNRSTSRQFSYGDVLDALMDSDSFDFDVVAKLDLLKSDLDEIGGDNHQIKLLEKDSAIQDKRSARRREQFETDIQRFGLDFTSEDESGSGLDSEESSDGERESEVDETQYDARLGARELQKIQSSLRGYSNRTASKTRKEVIPAQPTRRSTRKVPYDQKTSAAFEKLRRAREARRQKTKPEWETEIMFRLETPSSR